MFDRKAPLNDHERALAAWLELVAEHYDDSAPTPSGIAPDLQVHVNGVLQYHSVGEYRKLLREATRRFPDWYNHILQEFGDENGQCIVWRSQGKTPDGKTTMDLHGVTMIESENGIVHTAKLFFESGSQSSVYATPLGLRAV